MWKPSQRIWLFWMYVSCTAMSLISAFMLRFDFELPAEERRHVWVGLAIFIPIKVTLLWWFRSRRHPWRPTDVYEVVRLAEVNLLASSIGTAVCITVVGKSFPRSIYIADLLLCFLLTAGLETAQHIYRDLVVPRFNRRPGRNNIIIYGAGVAGVALARELHINTKMRYRLLGLLDDDVEKVGGTVFGGYKVLGTGSDAPQILARYRRRGTTVDEVVIAMPSAGGQAIARAVANCRAAGVASRIIPGVAELLHHQVLTRQIRNVSVVDLLGRPPVSLDTHAISREITGKAIMVTGGCGSIGSELCRQIARFQPKRVVIVDNAETPLFHFEHEFRSLFPNVSVAADICDVRNRRGIADCLARYSVDAVFHAAAYKHVPIMERSVVEAVENNILGTLNVAQAAMQVGCERFLMISSDKAVNPTSVMGVTKRVAEMFMSALPLDGSRTKTRFVSVRFGNVLGSNGSVVPIFQQQIAAGGPVTVTHPEMRRFFMTIPEAAQLVLQAYSMGHGSEIFMLDMGEPVRIVDLARNMIHLAGLEPDRDIEIHYTGLRPGEKLYEELWSECEHTLPTHHEKINILRTTPPSQEVLLPWLEHLKHLVDSRNEHLLLEHLAVLVPEYLRSGVERTDAASGRAVATVVGQ